MTRKIYIISDICVACGSPISEGEMCCRRCMEEAEAGLQAAKTLRKGKQKPFLFSKQNHYTIS